jgi:hypothetical protein
MRNRYPHPRIAWIAPFTRTGREHFSIAQAQFAAYGFSNLEYCDIDEAPNQMQLAVLDQYEVIYLSGGDPIGFRRNILRSGLSTQLRQSLIAGSLVVAAVEAQCNSQETYRYFVCLLHLSIEYWQIEVNTMGSVLLNMRFCHT